MTGLHTYSPPLPPFDYALVHTSDTPLLKKTRTCNKYKGARRGARGGLRRGHERAVPHYRPGPRRGRLRVPLRVRIGLELGSWYRLARRIQYIPPSIQLLPPQTISHTRSAYSGGVYFGAVGSILLQPPPASWDAFFSRVWIVRFYLYIILPPGCDAHLSRIPQPHSKPSRPSRASPPRPPLLRARAPQLPRPQPQARQSSARPPAAAPPPLFPRSP